MVLLVTILLSVTAISAADIYDSTSTPDASSSGVELNNPVTNDNTNIESNSIEKQISNEYETITNTDDTQSDNINSSINDVSNKKTNNTSDKSNKSDSESKKSIKIDTDSISAFANENVTIKAKVTTTDNVNVDDASVVLKINGNTVGQTTVVNGLITYDYTIPNWKAKDYTLTIKVGETDTTSAEIAESKLTIKKHDVTINLNSTQAKSEENIQIKAVITDDEGNLVDGVKVVYKVNSKTIASTTAKNGIASINYTVPRRAGTYPLLIKVGESALTNFNSDEKELIIIKRNSSIEVNDLLLVQKGNSITLKASVTNDGKVEATGKLGFKINGKTISLVQMENSTASYKYDASKLGVGNYTISVVYGGSGALNEERLNTTLRVVKNPITTYTLEQILQKANLTEEFIIKNNQLPNYALMNGNQVSMPDFLYMLCQVVVGNTQAQNGGFSRPESSLKTTAYGTLIEEKDFVPLAKNIIQCYITNGRAPNKITTSSNVSISFEDTVYLYTRIVSFINDSGRLPTYVKLVSAGSASSSSSNSESSSSSSSTTDSNYTSSNTAPSGFSEYLAVTKNCQVNSTTIKNAVEAATKGVTGVYNQAKAIFDYVNAKTSYSSYFDTRYGAIGTLTRGYGNCVDMSHLLIAMTRTANIPARYCHSTCYFRSGLVVGHVWAEIYVNGKWYSCDATSNSNTFGNIVNWNRCTSIKRYSSLPF